MHNITWENNNLSYGVSDELAPIIPKIIEACKEEGLDPFPLAIEEYDADEIAELAAYGGFPVRYPHFTFGQQFEQQYHSYHNGMGKIYEMVVNTDPTYMFLQRNNPIVDNVTVVAHALAHSDFFKNNDYFKQTNRKMMDVMANHGLKIREYMNVFGKQKVTDFLNACLAIDDLVDPSLMYKECKQLRRSTVDHSDTVNREYVARFDTNEYMDHYVNKPEWIEKQRKERDARKERESKIFPVKPERDIMLFMINYAPLENWQRNILSMIRDEALYYQPQIMTKVMNEGWASYWDSYIMTRKGFAGDAGIFSYAQHHAGVLGGKYNMSNPYKLGNVIFNDIKERWDKGRFGREWEECDDYDRKKNWDTKAMLGNEKIFDVRQRYNDVSFLSEFFTKELCHKHEFFEFALDHETNEYVVVSKDYEKIKSKLIRKYVNGGRPILKLRDIKNNAWVIDHVYDGRVLDLVYAKRTMTLMYQIVQKPIHVHSVAKINESYYDETYIEDCIEEHCEITYDGKTFTTFTTKDKTK